MNYYEELKRQSFNDEQKNHLVSFFNSYFEYIEKVRRHIFDGNKIRSEKHLSVDEKQEKLKRLDNARTNAHNKYLLTVDDFRNTYKNTVGIILPDSYFQNRTTKADFGAMICYNVLKIDKNITRPEGKLRDTFAEEIERGKIKISDIIEKIENDTHISLNKKENETMGYKSNPANNLETTIVLLATNPNIDPKDKLDILQNISKNIQAIVDYQKTICDYYIMNKFLRETSSYDKDGFQDAQAAVVRSDRMRHDAHNKMINAVRDLNQIAVHEAKGVTICEKEYMRDRWTMTDFATNFINGMINKDFDMNNPDQDKLVEQIESKKLYLQDAERKLQEMAETYGLAGTDAETETEQKVEP